MQMMQYEFMKVNWIMYLLLKLLPAFRDLITAFQFILGFPFPERLYDFVLLHRALSPPPTENASTATGR